MTFQSFSLSSAEAGHGRAAGGLVNARTLAVLILGCLVVWATTVAGLMTRTPGEDMTDIETFWLVGHLFWDGRLAEAYVAESLFAAQQGVLQTQNFMPYTYPPQFNFVTALIGAVPVWIGFAVFSAVSCGLYALALRRFGAAQAAFAFVVVFPAVALNLRTGQNGFLIAGLLALAVQAALARRVAGGAVLGLAAMKPHMAAGVGLAALLTRQWGLAALSLAVFAATLGAALAVFGVDVLAQFRGATAEAMGFLRAGTYPLHRMVSVYAFVRSFGASADVAMAVQAVSAAAAVLGLIALALRRAAPEVVLAAALVAPLFVSPYAYDYDMTVAGVALALVAPRLIARATQRELTALLALGWVATGWGVPMSFVDEQDIRLGGVAWLPSIQAVVNVGMLALVAAVLRRPAADSEGAVR